MNSSAKRCVGIVVGLFCCIVSIQTAHGETITLGTYNIEHFSQRFPSTTQKVDDKEIAARLRSDAEKNNWMASEVILNPKFSPDVLVLQECCAQPELEKFNKQWLKGLYETVVVFPGNSERKQHLGLMAKPGFKIVKTKDQYYQEPDPAGNDRGGKLFARGPAFVKMQSPSGYTFWVGVTHQKSKSGNSVDVTKWRKREAARTHAIMKELEKAGPDDVILLGDMNDEFGIQEYETEAGGDVIADLVGSPADGFILATKPLSDAAKISFGGYWRPNFRSFIDHIVISKGMKDQVEHVDVYTDGLAQAASDHYPVYIKIKTDEK